MPLIIIVHRKPTALVTTELNTPMVETFDRSAIDAAGNSRQGTLVVAEGGGHKSPHLVNMTRTSGLVVCNMLML